MTEIELELDPDGVDAGIEALIEWEFADEDDLQFLRRGAEACTRAYLAQAQRLRTLEQLVAHGLSDVLLYRWEQRRAQKPRLVPYIGWFDGDRFMSAGGDELDIKPAELAGWLPLPQPVEPQG